MQWVVPFVALLVIVLYFNIDWRLVACYAQGDDDVTRLYRESVGLCNAILVVGMELGIEDGTTALAADCERWRAEMVTACFDPVLMLQDHWDIQYLAWKERFLVFFREACRTRPHQPSCNRFVELTADTTQRDIVVTVNAPIRDAMRDNNTYPTY